MPFDGSGNFVLPSPAYPAVSGTSIDANDRNTLDEGFATGLTNALTRDGQSPPTANIPMGSRKLTGLAAGTAAGDSLRYEQLYGTPRARATLTATAIANSVLTTLLGTEDYDIGAGYDPVTGKYTAPATGYYRTSCMFQFPIGVDNTGFTGYLYKNGVLMVAIEQNFAGTTGSSMTIYDELYLAAGDYLEYKVLQATGGSKNLDAYCTFAYAGA